MAGNRGFQGKQGMPLPEAQMLIIASPLSQWCVKLLEFFTVQESLHRVANASALNLTVASWAYQGFVFGPAVREPGSSKHVLSFYQAVGSVPHTTSASNWATCSTWSLSLWWDALSQAVHLVPEEPVSHLLHLATCVSVALASSFIYLMVICLWRSLSHLKKKEVYFLQILQYKVV